MKIVGHRGAKGLAPENTVAAFLKAIEHNVDEIECDVRVTADGVPILLHDPHLQDQAGNQLDVHSTNYQELKAHKADLPTLEEALRAVNKRVPVVIEVKPDVTVEPIVKVIKSLLSDGWNTDHFLLASFSFKTLQQLHELVPDITKVVNDRWSGVRATSRARRLGTKRITMNQQWLWSGFVRSMRRGGYQLNAYTLNDVAKAKHLAKHGLAGVVTDYPDKFE